MGGGGKGSDGREEFNHPGGENGGGGKGKKAFGKGIPKGKG